MAKPPQSLVEMVKSLDETNLHKTKIVFYSHIPSRFVRVNSLLSRFFKNMFILTEQYNLEKEANRRIRTG